ncbi:hypothetical protein C8J57DRAFT_1073387, partial [Mycena rebaudengoi]
PGCFALSDRLQLGGPHQVATGSFGDVWKGLIRGETPHIHRETFLIWRQLSHPNLLPFFGLYHLEDTKSRLCLISPWMENGDITRYLKRNSVGVNRLTLVLDAGLGLEHLHSLKLVHGDLKAVWAFVGFDISTLPLKPFQINFLVTRSG